MRPEIVRFAEALEARLEEFQLRAGNSWKSILPDQLIRNVECSAGKLVRRALEAPAVETRQRWEDGSIRQQAIDTAAWCLFVAEKAEGRDKELGYRPAIFVDCDGTLVKAGTDELLPGVVEKINALYDAGNQVWLWTARPLTLSWIEPFKAAGLKFDGVIHKPLSSTITVLDDRFIEGRTQV